MKKMKLLPLVAAMLALNAPLAMATGDAQTNSAPTAINQQHDGWLGVYIRPMPHALASYLSDLMPSGEGILVDRVQPDSPAAKAGIQSNDILLSFNDQKLYSPAQLTRLVASSPTGSKVKLQIIRKGKVETVDTEIGQRPVQFNQPPRRDFRPPIAQQRMAPSQPMMPQQRPMPHAIPKMQPPALAWDSFESVVVKTLPDGRYHAEVSYKDQNNETKSFTFEGKKEEIVQQIRQSKELPADKREALLNALNMNAMDHFMPFRTPWMQRNPFDDPFFRNGGFDDFFRRDPFFNQGGTPFRSPFFDRFAPPQWQQPQQPDRR